jgi:hypothetical protein
MPIQDHLPLSHSNRNSADSACGHCDGVIRHEPWCITQSDPGYLSPGDHLILHALGASWTAKRTRSKRRH